MDKYIKSNINNIPKLKFLTKYIYNIDGFIAGGCFKNIFKNQSIRDIDIFFKTREDFDKALSLYLNTRKYKKIYENDNCVAFRNFKNQINIELVKSRFGTPEEIIDLFDFTIVKAVLQKEEFIFHPQFFEHLSCNKLVIDDIIFKSEATLNRAFKYYGYGYGLCRESKIKLIEAIKQTANSEAIDKNIYFGFD